VTIGAFSLVRVFTLVCVHFRTLVGLYVCVCMSSWVTAALCSYLSFYISAICV
jgi:hypothetical protein